MRALKKNLKKFFIYFFTSVSVLIVVLGVSRARQGNPLKTLPAGGDNDTGTKTSSGKNSSASVKSSGVFSGKTYQTPWGNVVASVQVKGGEIVAVTMPSIPNSPPSLYAEPYLVDQALKAGGANIQGVSGATYTSIAFKTSLENALAQAKGAQSTELATTNTTTSSQTVNIATLSIPRVYHNDDGDEYERDKRYRDSYDD